MPQAGTLENDRRQHAPLEPQKFGDSQQYAALCTSGHVVARHRGRAYHFGPADGACFHADNVTREFDVREASCYRKEDQTRLLAIVEAGFEGIDGARARARGARLASVA